MLLASKADTVLPDGTIGYSVIIRNLGDDPLTNVAFADTPDANTDIVPGSVDTADGTVTDGNDPGDTAIAVDIGDLDPNSDTEVTYRVSTAATPPDVAAVTNQGTVTSAELPPVLTDDPDRPGIADPTSAPVYAGGSGGGGGGGGAGGACATISGPLPADGATITGPAPVGATIAPKPDKTIASWKVIARPADTTDTPVTIGQGTGTPPATLGTFDATLVANGTWLVTTIVGCAGGATSSTSTSIIVEGRLKVGDYSVTYEDLNVPVAGIPISVRRTYSTLNRHHDGDFGYGWNLDVSNFRVQVNRPLGQGGWEHYQCGGGWMFVDLCYRTTNPHYVTVTWPDGRVETFDFTPEGLNSFYPAGAIPAYTGRAGTSSTLEPAPGDSSAGFRNDGNLYAGGFGNGPIYNPQRFVLVDRYGIRYTLDRADGLVAAEDLNGNTITVTPDGITSSSGPGVTFARDAQGRVEAIVGPAGETHSYTYTATGDLDTHVDGSSHTTDLDYIGGHYLDSIVGPDSPQVTMLYEDGRLVGIVDGEGNETLFESDLGELTETLFSPDGRLTSIFSLDADGDVTQRDDFPTGGGHLVSTFEHDDAGRLTHHEDPEGNATSVSYDARGNVLRLERGGLVRKTSYDELSRPVDIRVGGTVVRHNDYDERGNLLSYGTPGLSPTVNTVDARGRIDSVTEPEGRVVELGYDQHGYLANLDTPTGPVAIVSNAAGNTLSMTDQEGATTTFEYDGNGSLAGIIDDHGEAQRWRRNSLGLVDRYTDKAGRHIDYLYDNAGRLAQRTDRNGEVTIFESDSAGRPLSVTAPGVAISNEYDPFGRLVAVENLDQRVEFERDGAGALESQTTSAVPGAPQPTSTIGYQVDALGRPETVTGPGSTTSYQYDSLGRLTGIDDSVAGVFDLDHDATSLLLASIERPNGVDTEFEFDDAGRLLEKNAVDSLGAVLARAEYHYDAGGRPDSFTDIDGVHTYSYDDVGRLEAATHPAAAGLGNETYQYDELGNRTQWHGNPAAMVTYTEPDRLASDATFTYQYDGEGNLTSKTARDGAVATYFSWNALHQLVEIEAPDGAITEFVYDGLGRRIAVEHEGEVTRLVNDGLNVRAITNAAGTVTASYVHEHGYDAVLAQIQPSGEVAYPLTDGNRTVAAITDDQGAVTARFRYDSFGNPAAANPAADPTNSFTGLTADTSGLYFARARYLDPTIGRFLGEDPVTAVNPYSYANNNPLSFTDPSGETAMLQYAGTVAHNAQATIGLVTQIQGLVYSAVEGGIDDATITGACRVIGGSGVLVGIGAQYASWTKSGRAPSLGALGVVLSAASLVFGALHSDHDGPLLEDPDAQINGTIAILSILAITNDYAGLAAIGAGAFGTARC